MQKASEILSKVEGKIRGKRIFKIVGYVGLVISLILQDVPMVSAGFLNILLMVLLIDLSGSSFELVEDAKEEDPAESEAK